MVAFLATAELLILSGKVLQRLYLYLLNVIIDSHVFHNPVQSCHTFD